MGLILGVSALQYLLFRENQLAYPLQLIKNHNTEKESIILQYKYAFEWRVLIVQLPPPQ